MGPGVHRSRPHTLFVTSRISVVEVVSALNRRQREGSLSPTEYLRMVTDFATLCPTAYQLVDVTEEVVDRTRRLLEQHVLRAYDAIQLASALLTDHIIRAGGEPPLMLLAADERVLTAARSEGLAVDTPHWHP